MDGEPHGQRLGPAVVAELWVRLAAWSIAVGIALSSVTVALSALNAISTQQAIATGLPAVLITVAGIGGLVVPDAWIAWRRGFRRGCEAAALASQADLIRAGDAGIQLREVRLADVVTCPGHRCCAVCGRALS
jgi:hypothetical protein